MFESSHGLTPVEPYVAVSRLNFIFHLNPMLTHGATLCRRFTAKFVNAEGLKGKGKGRGRGRGRGKGKGRGRG